MPRLFFFLFGVGYFSTPSFFSLIWSTDSQQPALALSYSSNGSQPSTHFQAAAHASEEHVIVPLPHTWAQRYTWLASVAVIDRGHRVFPSHPESMTHFFLPWLLTMNDCSTIRIQTLTISQSQSIWELMLWLLSSATSFRPFAYRNNSKVNSTVNNTVLEMTQYSNIQ